MQSRIREVRQQRGLTLGQLAERCDPPTTAQTIGRLETGMRRLSLPWLNRIAAALGVDAAQLVATGATDSLPYTARLSPDGAAAFTSPPGYFAMPVLTDGQIAVHCTSSVGDFAAGDSLLFDRFDGAPNDAALIGQIVLLPGRAGDFHCGRLVSLGSRSVELLALSQGSGGLQSVKSPAWHGVLRHLIRSYR